MLSQAPREHSGYLATVLTMMPAGGAESLVRFMVKLKTVSCFLVQLYSLRMQGLSSNEKCFSRYKCVPAAFCGDHSVVWDSAPVKLGNSDSAVGMTAADSPLMVVFKMHAAAMSPGFWCPCCLSVLHNFRHPGMTCLDVWVST